ncbi:MAG: hypothetical protein FWE71_05430 [Nocardioidaceae bacterium]|nr:hypothetical protein [Nocardioidaceae bacterium]MCL2612014.1 hypothetical protein [Nocardioidaceae bacterium]
MTDQPQSPAPAVPVPPATVLPARKRGLPMVLRHVIGLVVAIVVTPIGLFLFDYGARDYAAGKQIYLRGIHTPRDLLIMAVAAVLLLLVAVSARISAVGPLVGGLLFGVIPFLWYQIDTAGFASFSRSLPSTQLWFGAAPYEFPLIAVGLVGAGLAGRWRRRVERAVVIPE